MKIARFYNHLVLFVTLVLLLAFAIRLLNSPTNIEIQMKSSESGKIQVFWKKPSQIFTEARSLSTSILKSDQLTNYQIKIPSGFLNEIRIDLNSKPSLVEIRSINIKHGFWSKSIAGNNLKEALGPLNQIERLELNNQDLLINCNGEDSQLSLNILDIKLISLAAYTTISILLLILFVFLTIKINFPDHPLLNQETSGHFNSLIVVYFLVIGFTFATLFKLHGSSLHAWYLHYPNLFFEQEHTLFGQARSIRSDEWLVQTPAIVSQSKLTNPFDTFNPSYGDGTAPILMGLPTSHISTLFRPQYWGFFLFDIEHAFSWWWNFRILSCLLGVYLLLKCLTAGKEALSIIGSIWFFCSEFVQWWLSSGVPELCGSFSLAFCSIYYLLYSQVKSSIYLAAICLCLFTISFILQLYPPFQIPLIWLGITLLITIFFSDKFRKNTKHLLKLKLILLAVVTVCTLTILFCYFHSVKDSAVLLSHTAYPGVRSESGGSFTLARYFSGFAALSMSETNFPGDFGNISEGSSFILIWPLLLLSIIFSKRQILSPYLLPIATFLVLLSSYVIIGWPAVLAKATLLDMVPSARAIIAIGLANVCLSAIVISAPKSKNYSNILPIILIIGAAFYFWQQQTEKTLGEFFDFPEYLVAITTIILMTLPILFKNQTTFILSACIFSIVTLSKVNPLVSGLKPLLDNKVTQAVASVPSNYKSSRWLIYGDFILPSLFKASGVNTFSGAKYVPQLDLWKKLDPNEKFLDVYNRYAHFQFEPHKNSTDINMQLIQADLVNVQIAPCSEKLSEIGIDVIVIPNNLSNIDLSCLKQHRSILDSSGFTIYLRQSSIL